MFQKLHRVKRRVGCKQTACFCQSLQHAKHHVVDNRDTCFGDVHRVLILQRLGKQAHFPFMPYTPKTPSPIIMPCILCSKRVLGQQQTLKEPIAHSHHAVEHHPSDAPPVLRVELRDVPCVLASTVSLSLEALEDTTSGLNQSRSARTKAFLLHESNQAFNKALLDHSRRPGGSELHNKPGPTPKHGKVLPYIA